MAEHQQNQLTSSDVEAGEGQELTELAAASADNAEIVVYHRKQPIEAYIHTLPASSAPEMPAPLDIVKPKKRFRRLKRFLWRFSLPLLLGGFGWVMLAIFGGEGISSVERLIEQLWLPAALLRYSAYVFICWLLIPRLYQKAQAKQLAHDMQLYDMLYQHPNADQEAIWALEERMRRVAASKLKPIFVFLILVVFDLMAVELPFLLK